MKIQVSPAVWVAHAWRPPCGEHPGDRRAADGLPPWRQRERLAARGLLRDLLCAVAPAAADAELLVTAGGKPALAGWPGIGISISHDGDAVAAAVALRGAVGVDVQLAPDHVPDRMLRRCLRERAAELESLSPAQRATELAWVWSVQEACVKADGSGVAGRPWAIDVPVRPRAGRWGRWRWLALRDHVETPVSCAFGTPPC